MTNHNVVKSLLLDSTIFDYEYDSDNYTVYLMLEKNGAKSILMIAAYTYDTKWQHVAVIPWQYYNDIFPNDPRPVNEYGIVQ